MASMQCYKPANETSQQRYPNQSSSLGQKVSDMATFLKGGMHRSHGQPHTTTHTTVYSETVIYQTSGHQGLDRTKHQTVAGRTDGMIAKHQAAGKTNGMMSRHGKTKKTRGGVKHNNEVDNRNLFQKIKDGISGNSSCSDSGESDSDHEGGYRKYKN